MALYSIMKKHYKKIFTTLNVSIYIYEFILMFFKSMIVRCAWNTTDISVS